MKASWLPSGWSRTLADRSRSRSGSWCVSRAWTACDALNGRIVTAVCGSCSSVLDIFSPVPRWRSLPRPLAYSRRGTSTSRTCSRPAWSAWPVPASRDGAGDPGTPPVPAPPKSRTSKPRGLTAGVREPRRWRSEPHGRFRVAAHGRTAGPSTRPGPVSRPGEHLVAARAAGPRRQAAVPGRRPRAGTRG